MGVQTGTDKSKKGEVEDRPGGVGGVQAGGGWREWERGGGGTSKKTRPRCLR